MQAQTFNIRVEKQVGGNYVRLFFYEDGDNISPIFAVQVTKVEAENGVVIGYQLWYYCRPRTVDGAASYGWQICYDPPGDVMKKRRLAKIMPVILAILMNDPDINRIVRYREPGYWLLLRDLVVFALENGADPSDFTKMDSPLNNEILYVSRNYIIPNPAFFWKAAQKMGVTYKHFERWLADTLFEKCNNLPLEKYYDCVKRKANQIYWTLANSG